LYWNRPAKLGRLTAGFDPEMALDGLTLAGYHIEAGARRFLDYARMMIEDLSDRAIPHLAQWYTSVRMQHGFDTAGMDDAATVEAAHARMMETGRVGGTDSDSLGEPGSGEAGSGGPGAGLAAGGQTDRPLEDLPPEDGGGVGGGGAGDAGETGIRPGPDALSDEGAVHPGGMPIPDAEEEATKDWLIMEPEDETPNRRPRLLDLTSS
jgi:hypothetical protein